MNHLQDLESASKGNASMRRLLNRILEWQSAMEQALGVDPLLTKANKATALFAAPPPATLEVTGVDNIFQVKITNPSSVKVPLVHQLQSSPTVPFEASLLVNDYGQSVQTSFAIADPNQSYFWRLRSRYPHGLWNGWQTLDAVATEPIIIDGGDDS